MRQRGDTQEVGDSPDRGRLDDVDCPRRDQRAELLQAGEVLPGGDRRPYATADSGQAVGVPAPDRLLDPGQVECAFHFADVADRLLAAPGLVRVQHEPWPGPVRGLGQYLAHEQQPVPVTLDVQAALELRRPQPAFGIDLVDGDELVVGEADVQAGGVGVDHAVAAAEQPPQRLTHGLCLDVPQRRVERADRAEHRAGVPGLEGVPQHAVVEGGHGARVLAVDGGENRLEFHVRPQADAGDPLIGLDDDDRHGHDAVDVDAVGVTDRSTPLLRRRQGSVPGDAHASALRRAGRHAVGDLALEEEVGHQHG